MNKNKYTKLQTDFYQGFNTPILFLIFNRPDTTQKVFNIIRQIKPKYLFVAADGPRKDHPDDRENCKKAREIIQEVDWNCNIKTLFREENLSGPVASPEAISWFFNKVNQGIILEDDCLPAFSFFSFCQAMLNYYKNNQKIMCVTGLNWQNGKTRGNGSYYFSNYPGIWGWATWADRWAKFDYELKGLNKFIRNNKIKKITQHKREQKHHIETFTVNRKVVNWDYKWKFTLFDNKGLCVVPNKNLISNIGFGKNASNNKDPDNWRANQPIYELDEKIIHPTEVIPNKKADNFTAKRLFIPKSNFKKQAEYYFKRIKEELF